MATDNELDIINESPIRFHSTYVGVDGSDYFLTLYVKRPESLTPIPVNFADGLTQREAEALSAILERLGDRLTLDDLLGWETTAQ